MRPQAPTMNDNAMIDTNRRMGTLAVIMTSRSGNSEELFVESITISCWNDCRDRIAGAAVIPPRRRQSELRGARPDRRHLRRAHRYRAAFARRQAQQPLQESSLPASSARRHGG